MYDSAFVYIKLCHAAGSMSLMDRGGDSAESLMFKNEAIKIILSTTDWLDHPATLVREPSAQCKHGQL
jgi:hypothetical protein